MSSDSQLLEIVVCPKCRGRVASVDSGEFLVCDRCKLKYPVRDGIPVMIIEEAIDLLARAHMPNGSPVKLSRVTFRVIEGPDQNMTFHLEEGTCRAIGRASHDLNKTTVFNVDLALSLDESTRSLILQYVSKQFRKSAGSSRADENKIGQFKRAPDIVLNDSSLSRLHAMIFSDESGIGILDLVSKNGTYVNGTEVESKLLKRGDVIELGETSMSYEG